MPDTDPNSVAALQAATDLLAAFGAHDSRRYFDAFAPEATFLFHAEPELIASRAGYEAKWADWERDGFQVLSCRSVDPRLDMLTDDVAVYTHTVRTQLAGVDDELRERETIILRRNADGRWLGVHEHLSLDTRDDDA